MPREKKKIKWAIYNNRGGRKKKKKKGKTKRKKMGSWFRGKSPFFFKELNKSLGERVEENRKRGGKMSDNNEIKGEGGGRVACWITLFHCLETIVQRDAGCTIVEPTRGDRQRAWGMGLLWQLKGAHMTSKHTEVSQGEGEKNLICSHSHGISWRIRG